MMRGHNLSGEPVPVFEGGKRECLSLWLNGIYVLPFVPTASCLESTEKSWASSSLSLSPYQVYLHPDELLPQLSLFEVVQSWLSVSPCMTDSPFPSSSSGPSPGFTPVNPYVPCVGSPGLDSALHMCLTSARGSIPCCWQCSL